LLSESKQRNQVAVDAFVAVVARQLTKGAKIRLSGLGILHSGARSLSRLQKLAAFMDEAEEGRPRLHAPSLSMSG
jgi:uncharacterized membrane-anchored protein